VSLHFFRCENNFIVILFFQSLLQMDLRWFEEKEVCFIIKKFSFFLQRFTGGAKIPTVNYLLLD